MKQQGNCDSQPTNPLSFSHSDEGETGNIGLTNVTLCVSARSNSTPAIWVQRYSYYHWPFVLLTLHWSCFIFQLESNVFWSFIFIVLSPRLDCRFYLTALLQVLISPFAFPSTEWTHKYPSAVRMTCGTKKQENRGSFRYLTWLQWKQTSGMKGEHYYCKISALNVVC